MLKRREFLLAAAALGLGNVSCRLTPREEARVLMDDIHAHLNATWVDEVIPVDSLAAARKAVKRAMRSNKPLAIAGGRHALGGQQLAAEALLIDTAPLKRVLNFDRERGTIEVEAGIHWPDLIAWMNQEQSGAARQWSIIQKQTGTDNLSLGGAVGSNIHGRGLKLKPFIDSVESIELIDADGGKILLDRGHEPDLFKLVIGGYGLFGLAYSIKLKLELRRKMRRDVEIIDADRLMSVFDERIKAGYEYGDWQFMTDKNSELFVQRGVMSCYRPVPDDTPLLEKHKQLHTDDWLKLAYLAHAEPTKAFQVYADYYLTTTGQIYWSDQQQLSTYVKDYHQVVDRQLQFQTKHTEMLTEIYVPRPKFAEFMAAAAEFLRGQELPLIYGTVRLIEAEDESFLRWARESWVCVIFNLCVEHTDAGIATAATSFQGLIDCAIKFGGCYYLTYHKWARRDQVLACYPQFPEFLKMKMKYDPQEIFQSNWYRHYKAMFMS